jgi:GNAT superfamily N-acetyltransferase
MIKLAEMSAASFQAFREYSIRSYAKDNIDAGRWSPDGAIERAREDVDSMLPDGKDTNDHWFFNLESKHDTCAVGYLWFAVIEKGGLRGGYIYDFEVYEKYRRQGFARLALQQIKRLGKEMELPFIDLHVFGSNSGAKNLYETEGFSVMGVNMRKLL